MRSTKHPDSRSRNLHGRWRRRFAHLRSSPRTPQGMEYGHGLGVDAREGVSRVRSGN